MTLTTHIARVTGPLGYLANGGEMLTIPLGPCLIEWGDGERVDIVWGAKGETSAGLPPGEIESAESAGNLVLLD